MKQTGLCVFLLAMLLLPHPAPGGTVTVKGISFYEEGREPIAREKALEEAKRAAIEKALGTRMESRTVVENFQVIRDRIFSHASGYLSNVEVLEERKTDFGTYEVTIRAEVKTSEMVGDMDRFRQAAGEHSQILEM